ncbi:sialidase family protein [Crossiella cryophila]|uniref:Uncharacterized protein n=1 Tax=Crossiella cryophila TaxID=43355 RepID=A0A7W7CAY6_9PSEU|nr:sialidase family protein [Crossiella cryophila]MBB4677773.1 hypothetical protein [Crossiella cryophila]
MRARPWRRRLATALLTGALLVGAAGTAPPAAAAVPIDLGGLANTLLGSYLRIVDADRDYARHLVATAELADWRAANAQADQNALTAHLAATQQAIETAVPERVWAQQTHEVVGASLHALRSAPGALLTGPRIEQLTAALVGRDAPTLTGRIADRIGGALPHLAWNTGFDNAQAAVWTALGGTARVDAAFKGAWDAGVGALIGVGAAMNHTQLGALPRLKQVLDVAPVLAAAANPVQFRTLTRQLITSQVQVVSTERQAGFTSMVAISITVVAGKPETPEEKRKAEAEAAEKKRQGILNGAKGAIDGLAWLVGRDDPEGARQIKALAAGALQIATAVNKAVTAFKLIDSVFSMATVAFTGNVIGAISTIASLFAGAGPTVEQLILEEIGKLREQVAKLHEDMTRQFARIDRRLDDMYTGISQQLQQLDAAVEVVKGRVAEVAQHLTELEVRTQAIGNAVTEGIANTLAQPTWDNANLVIDYKRTRPGQPVTFAMYDQAENVFQLAGHRTAALAPFVVPAGNYGTDPATARTNLSTHGTTGTVRYLAAYARARLDGAFPVPEEVVNPALWKVAANAYTLLAAQNPEHARKIVPERAAAVVEEGLRLREAAARFSEPGPGGATNTLFTSLLNNYRNELVRFFEETAKRATEVTRDRYSLWHGPKQDVADAPGVIGPDEVPRCTAGPAQPLTRPGKVDGSTLPPAQMFARNVLPNPPAYAACWTAPEWVNETISIVPKECERPGERGCEIHYKWADLRVQFQQNLRWPSGENLAGRWLTGITKRMVVQTCHGSKNGVTGGCQDRADARQVLVNEWGTLRENFDRTATWVDPEIAEQTAVGHMTEFLKQRQREYYSITARHIRDTDAARDLNLAVSLLRAYTELGFPRALETDDHLRALLYGGHALHTSGGGDGHLLAGTYDQAAANLAAGKPPWESDQHESPDCPRLPGLSSQDPFAVCTAASAKLRLDRLGGRYAEQFKQRWEGTDQSLPEVQRLARSLWLVIKAAHPASTLNPRLDLPAPIAPAQARWSQPVSVEDAATPHGGAATVTFQGRQHIAWRGADNQLYASSTVDGRSWTPKVLVGSGGEVGAHQSLAVFQGKLVLSWRFGVPQRPSAPRLATSPDGQTWTAAPVSPGLGDGKEPAVLAEHNGTLYALTRGFDQALSLSSTTDLVTWTAKQRILPDQLSSHRAALTAANGRLYLAWKAADSPEIRLATSQDGRTWSGPARVSDGGTSTGVALTVAQGKVHAAWQGLDPDRTMHLAATTDGVTWTPRHSLARTSRTAQQPALTALGGRLRAVWLAEDSQYLMSATSAVLPG